MKLFEHLGRLKICVLQCALFIFSQLLFSCSESKETGLTGTWMGAQVLEFNEQRKDWEVAGNLFAALEIEGVTRVRAFEYFAKEVVSQEEILGDSIMLFHWNWYINESMLPDTLILEESLAAYKRKRLFFVRQPESLKKVEIDDVKNKYVEFVSNEDTAFNLSLIPSDSGCLISMEYSTHRHISEERHVQIHEVGNMQVLTYSNNWDLFSGVVLYSFDRGKVKAQLRTNPDLSPYGVFLEKMSDTQPMNLLEPEQHAMLKNNIVGTWQQKNQIEVPKFDFDSTELVPLVFTIDLRVDGRFYLDKYHSRVSGKDSLLLRTTGVWDLGPLGQNILLQYPSEDENCCVDVRQWIPIQILNENRTLFYMEFTSGNGRMQYEEQIEFGKI